MVNVISAVIIDRQFAEREKNQDLQYQMFRDSVQALRDMFSSIDTDGTMDVSLGDLESAYDTIDDFRQATHLLGISRDDLEMLFEILDPDESGSVELDEFVDR